MNFKENAWTIKIIFIKPTTKLAESWPEKMNEQAKEQVGHTIRNSQPIDFHRQNGPGDINDIKRKKANPL